MKKLLTLLILIAVAASAHAQEFANIVYGSKSTSGGALFFGTDSAAADSITIGYFSGVAANAAGTGFVQLEQSSTWNTNLIGFNAGSSENTVVTAANGSDAWLKIADGTNVGFINLDAWGTISGNPRGNSTPTSLDFSIVGTHENAYTAYGLNIASGGLAGTGYNITVAVPEPGTSALLVGFMAFTWVAIRRRK